MSFLTQKFHSKNHCYLERHSIWNGDGNGNGNTGRNLD